MRDGAGGRCVQGGLVAWICTALYTAIVEPNVRVLDVATAPAFERGVITFEQHLKGDFLHI